MTSIGQSERATQERVIALFRSELWLDVPWDFRLTHFLFANSVSA